MRFRGAAFQNEPLDARDHRTYFYGAGALEVVFQPRR